MKKILPQLFIITILFFCFTANAVETKKEPVMEYKPDGLYLTNITVSDLEDIYQIYKYNDYIYMPNWTYPPIFLNNLPVDFAKITDTKKRNKLFLQILAPLTLKLSNEQREERYYIRKLRMDFLEGAELTAEQEAFVEEKATKYDLFTRMKGHRRYDLLLKKLELQADIVPPSILIAAAAIESAWGTARPTVEANSLYKELVWYSEEGLTPKDETEDKTYKYKIFPTLYDSVKSYAHKLNTGINYEQMRFTRSEIERHDKPVLGRSLAHTMLFDSTLPNFAGILNYTLTFYELTNFDEAELGYIDIPSTSEDKKIKKID